jgi:hypothetical protein
MTSSLDSEAKVRLAVHLPVRAVRGKKAVNFEPFAFRQFLEAVRVNIFSSVGGAGNRVF